MILDNLLNRYTIGGLRFTLGEIDAVLMDGAHVRADVFQRQDLQWQWSARVTPESSDAIATGPHLTADEATAEADALAWIRARVTE